MSFSSLVNVFDMSWPICLEERMTFNVLEIFIKGVMTWYFTSDTDFVGEGEVSHIVVNPKNVILTHFAI